MTIRMGRRAFAFGLISLVVCLGPFGLAGPADAQQPAAPRRIGVLLVGTPLGSKQLRGLTQGLEDAGYVEGRDVRLE